MRAHRRLLIVLGITLLTLLVAGGGAFVVLNGRNQARPEAVAALQSDASVTVGRVAGQDWYVFSPTTGEVNTGLIIYPGGFVDPVAYAPIAREIAARGYLVVLDPMPLNLAVTGINSADAILAAFPEIAHWAIGGHSLGGAMAAEYVKNNPGAVGGLGLGAAYPAENTDSSSSPAATTPSSAPMARDSSAATTRPPSAAKSSKRQSSPALWNCSNSLALIDILCLNSWSALCSTPIPTATSSTAT